MKVMLNGEPQAAPAPPTVGAMVDALGRGRKGVAVAVNEEIVPRSQWDATTLHDGDRVEVLTAAQGG